MKPLAWRPIAAALARRVPERHLAPVLGDLLEDHAARIAQVGRLRAAAWLLGEAFSMWRAYRRPSARAGSRTATRRLAAFLESARLAPIARRLVREPAFSITAVATLALCLAGNLTILAVVDAVVLRPLPFHDPHRLVSVFNTYPRAGVPDDGCSVANYYDRRGRLPALSSISIYRERPAVVGESNATRVEPVIRVSPDFFETLGTPPVLGRRFAEAETTYGNEGVAIVTPAFWARSGGAGPAVGSSVRVDGAPVTVVGVLPDGFRFLSSEAGLFLPLASSQDDRLAARRHWGSSDMIARLAPGVTLAEAQAQLDVHNLRIEASTPEGPRMAEAGFRSIVKPPHAYHLAGAAEGLLLTQAGAVLLLVIGAVNLANLMLVRQGPRAREWAVRRAIGAGRRHVLADLLGETLLVSLAGGALAVPLAAAGVRFVTALVGGATLPLGARIGLTPALVLACFGGAAVLGLAIGLPVGWLGFRARLASGLRAGARGGTGGRSARRLRAAFATAQVALAFVLLSGAGLLGRSFANAMVVEPGFRAEGVVTGRVLLPRESYGDGAARLRFAEDVIDAPGGEPGVASAGVATNLPLSGQSARSAAAVAGRVLETPKGRYSYGVGGDYFETMGSRCARAAF